jgi:hypothetical protein
MAILFACVAVFLLGFRLLVVIAFPSLAIAAWFIVRKHPKDVPVLGPEPQPEELL